MYTKHDNPTTWWSMIRDETNGNSLKDIALQLFSIVPHAVMPERLFSMLDWQNTKRRNRLSPFTLESVSKIYTYHKNASNNESPIDMEKIEKCLSDELKAATEKSPTITTNDLSNSLETFMQTVDENQRILCELAGTDTIDEQNIEDKDLLDLTTMINHDDRELTKMFVDVGLAEEESNGEDDESIPIEATDDDGNNDDYNIDDILGPLFVERT
ncbi:unnamed protein product [Didymodactylos carnosus]|uniref:HAT C-terminal dimerisation domain-containing protein n=1 Tax=Didymodactylos carnosus TaxID=1234261 RepID=A0A815CFW5_9BILA|nr:unnamed protein product [Didymodactylos carnosus]CAF1279804.1 unnamed protein product [Didymodactylos carnosus]CAF3559860.1 unnamed protein product [Didymodactylos carnosus]CAF4074319.1 unnamed protein product [Didymodactylos carnosus]